MKPSKYFKTLASSIKITIHQIKVHWKYNFILALCCELSSGLYRQAFERFDVANKNRFSKRQLTEARANL